MKESMQWSLMDSLEDLDLVAICLMSLNSKQLQEKRISKGSPENLGAKSLRIPDLQALTQENWEIYIPIGLFRKLFQMIQLFWDQCSSSYLTCNRVICP